MQVYTLNSLVSDRDFDGFTDIWESKSIDVNTVKNAAASFHIVLSDEVDFEITNVNIALPDGVHAQSRFAENVIFGNTAYPDILSNEVTCKVAKQQKQSIWITFFVDKNAVAGLYPVTVKVQTSKGEEEITCNLKIFDVEIPDSQNSEFLTEYWIHVVNNWFRFPDSHSFDFVKYYYGCEKYSDEWWTINKAMAENMKESRINVLFVRTMDLLYDGGTTISQDGIVDFKWELFDKWVEWYLNHGSFCKLAGMHLVVQADGKNVFVIQRDENGNSVLGLAEEETPEAEKWLEQYLPALYRHLEEKGWKEMWMQHVMDEPAAADSWMKMIPHVRKLMPGIQTMDAIDSKVPMEKMQGGPDLWIPRVDIYEDNREFYDLRLANGEKRWVYTCCLPQEMNYVNKFIDWPLIHNRVIGWGCFKNQFTGFLHWGYDFWDPEGDLFGLNENAKVKGDGFIIYPDAKNKTICNSVRMLSTRDSAQDYELLFLLAKHNPAKAYEIAGKVIRKFNDFNWNPYHLEAVRLELLQELEGVVKHES